VSDFTYTPIKADATRVAALLSGEVDLLTDVGGSRRLLVFARDARRAIRSDLPRAVLAGRPLVYTVDSTSYMSVPLPGRGTLFGVLTFVVVCLFLGGWIIRQRWIVSELSPLAARGTFNMTTINRHAANGGGIRFFGAEQLNAAGLAKLRTSSADALNCRSSKKDSNS